VLSGEMMRLYTQEDLLELPETVNYPLHLHDEYPADYTFNQLIACRFETIKELQLGLEKIVIDHLSKHG
jgi:hypothetical protein